MSCLCFCSNWTDNQRSPLLRSILLNWERGWLPWVARRWRHSTMWCVIACCTILSHCPQFYCNWRYRLYYSARHCTTLYYTTLHNITLHCTTLHYTALHYTTLHCTIPHYTTLYCTILHYTVLHCTALYYTILYYTALHYTTVYYTTLHYTTLCNTLHYTILYYTALHYTTLYCTIPHSAIHYTALHCTTLHYTASVSPTVLPHISWYRHITQPVDSIQRLQDRRHGDNNTYSTHMHHTHIPRTYTTHTTHIQHTHTAYTALLKTPSTPHNHTVSISTHRTALHLWDETPGSRHAGLEHF